MCFRISMRNTSIELINYKYHDLKHQIAVLRSEADPGKREAFLDKMEADIKKYESQNKTGNKVLDTVLTTKSLYCAKNNITFTCVADGTLLEFMDVMDICSIFGNALDNAIECELKIPDKEKRLIHVSVSKQKNFLLLRPSAADFLFGCAQSDRTELPGRSVYHNEAGQRIPRLWTEKHSLYGK